MPKRFTETEKWNDPWFQDLPSKYKLLFVYLLDNCDNAGLWKINIKLATFQIGEPFELSEILRTMEGRARLTDDKKQLFIKKFIEFQQPNGLREDSAPHKQIISILKKNGLENELESLLGKGSSTLNLPLGKGSSTLNLPLGKGSSTLSLGLGKGRVRDKVKVIECNVITDEKRIDEKELELNVLKSNKNKEINSELINNKGEGSKQKPSISEIRSYCEEKGFDIDPAYFWNYYETRGWMLGKNKIKSWKACVRTWVLRRKSDQDSQQDKCPSYIDKEKMRQLGLMA